MHVYCGDNSYTSVRVSCLALMSRHLRRACLKLINATHGKYISRSHKAFYLRELKSKYPHISLAGQNSSRQFCPDTFPVHLRFPSLHKPENMMLMPSNVMVRFSFVVSCVLACCASANGTGAGGEGVRGSLRAVFASASTHSQQQLQFINRRHRSVVSS